MSALATIISRSKNEREDWRYTDVEKLLSTVKPASVVSLRKSSADLPCLINGAASHQRIVFLNGVLQRDQSQLGNLPSSVFTGDVEAGYRLSLAAQSCLVTAPIEFVLMSDGLAESTIKLAVDVGANASLNIVEHHISVGSDPANQIIEMDIHLGTQSKLVHKKIAHDLTNSAHFARAKVRVEAGAYYRNFSLMKHTRLMRNEIEVTLAGELAQCGLYGVMLLQAREHADMVTRVEHAAPHCISQQLYKAVIKDQARGVFQGRIKVAEGAQKTEGKQLCRALLLSDQAEMDAKPELEIYADDVACSHGCAIGDLDQDAMFYLRSRSLDENTARALLLRAFVDEVIDEIQAEDVRTFVHDLAGGWMNE